MSVQPEKQHASWSALWIALVIGLLAGLAIGHANLWLTLPRAGLIGASIRRGQGLHAAAGPMLDPLALMPADDPSGVQLPTARLEAAAAGSVPAAAAVAAAERMTQQSRTSRYLLWAALLGSVALLTWMALTIARQLRAVKPQSAATGHDGVKKKGSDPLFA